MIEESVTYNAQQSQYEFSDGTHEYSHGKVTSAYREEYSGMVTFSYGADGGFEGECVPAADRVAFAADLIQDLLAQIAILLEFQQTG